MKTTFLAAALLATALSGQAFADGCMSAKPADTAQISKPDAMAQAAKSTPDTQPAAVADAAAATSAVKPVETAAASTATQTVKPN